MFFKSCLRFLGRKGSCWRASRKKAYYCNILTPLISIQLEGEIKNILLGRERNSSSNRTILQPTGSNWWWQLFRQAVEIDSPDLAPSGNSLGANMRTWLLDIKYTDFYSERICLLHSLWTYGKNIVHVASYSRSSYTDTLSWLPGGLPNQSGSFQQPWKPRIRIWW